MQSQNELRNLLQRIDHKSYPAYKDTRGSYDFGNYVLSIDHVQGDPFAAPSKVSVHVRGGAAKFPADLYQMKCRRLAVCDYLLRQFGRELERVSFKAKGSGKSGLLAVSRPGQEVLERTACQMDEAKGDLVLRFEVGFPANGRTVNARELEKIFFTFLPECVSHSLFYKALDEKAVYRAADLAEDQQYIRDRRVRQTDEGRREVYGAGIHEGKLCAAACGKDTGHGNKERNHTHRRRRIPRQIHAA